MDARTFTKENEVQSGVHINFIALIFHNLNGGIIFDTMQKWYYYSMQTTKEVLVFHQYTKVNKMIFFTKLTKNYPFRANTLQIPTQHLRTETVPRIPRVEYQ